MKKTIFMILLFAFSQGIYAKAPDYYQGKGRIALSSDGNMHDNDDMQATMLSLMILAKANLQDKTTLYTYADHIWGSEKNDLDIMTRSAEETGKHFGFGNTIFIAAVENVEASYKAMCEQILKSTEEDPLFIVAAGPMQLVGEALDRANKIDSNALNYVTVISHSHWNDVHADNPEKNPKLHGVEPDHSGWTWKKMCKSFSDKVNFNHISDQNGTGKNPYITHDKFSFGKWDKIMWLSQHKDPNIRWLYSTSKKNPVGPDFSDAGMLYYLCADLNGERGDQMGNDVKLKEWVGEEIINVNPNNRKINITKNGGIVVGEDFIAIEADATSSPLGDWVLRNEKDPLYNGIKGHPKATGGKYLEYMGGTEAGSQKKDPESDALEYRFTPMTSGVYNLTGRLGQRLELDGDVQANDRCNDVYIKMIGDFSSANNAPLEVLQNWNKFYGRGLNTWGAFTCLDVNHKKYIASYNLKAGKEYVFKISGRSKRCCIDYMIFVKAPYQYGEHKNIAAINPIKYRPSLENVGSAEFSFKINSTDFKIINKNVSIDKTRNVLQVAQPNANGMAEFIYQGQEKDGVKLFLNTMMEIDGESQYNVFVNDKLIGSAKNPKIHNTQIKDYTIKHHKITDNLNLKTGDKIKVEFKNHSNNLVPEGNSFATSRARWVDLELITKNY